MRMGQSAFSLIVFDWQRTEPLHWLIHLIYFGWTSYPLKGVFRAGHAEMIIGAPALDRTKISRLKAKVESIVDALHVKLTLGLGGELERGQKPWSSVRQPWLHLVWCWKHPVGDRDTTGLEVYLGSRGYMERFPSLSPLVLLLHLCWDHQSDTASGWCFHPDIPRLFSWNLTTNSQIHPLLKLAQEQEEIRQGGHVPRDTFDRGRELEPCLVLDRPGWLRETTSLAGRSHHASHASAISQLSSSIFQCCWLVDVPVLLLSCCFISQSCLVGWCASLLVWSGRHVAEPESPALIGS